MLRYILPFVTAAGAALILTPFLRRWARRADWLDLPSARRGHARAVPRVGGVVLVVSVGVALAVVFLAARSHDDPS